MTVYNQPKIPFKRKYPEEFQRDEESIELNYSEFTQDLGVLTNINFDLQDLNANSERIAESNYSYVEQFELCLNGVLESERFLVDERIAQQFFNLQQISKEVYIKLFNRMVKWIPVSKLATERISVDEIYAGVLQLSDLDFVDNTGPTTFEEWESLATRSVLEEICKDKGIKQIKSLQKHEIAQRLQLNFCDSIIDLIRDKLGSVVKINANVKELFNHYFVIYQRLTSWPVDEKLMTVSILANLKTDNINRRSFTKIEFERCSLIWPTKDDFIKYLEALKLSARCELLCQSKDAADFLKVLQIHDEISPSWKKECLKKETHVTGISWFGVFTCGWVQTRIKSFAYQVLYKLKRYQECCSVLHDLVNQRLFCSSRRGRWYDEYCKTLELHIDKKMAKQICKEALSDTFVMTGHRHSILKRLERLCKKSNTISVELWDYEDRQQIPQKHIKGKQFNRSPSNNRKRFRNRSS